MRSLPLLLLVACAPAPKVETETLTNVGHACLNADGDIELDFETCLSSSCDTLISAVCSATLDGDTLTITSEAVIETEGTECTDDCGFVGAVCDGDTVVDPSGITVVIGDESHALEACDDEGF